MSVCSMFNKERERERQEKGWLGLGMRSGSGQDWHKNITVSQSEEE